MQAGDADGTFVCTGYQVCVSRLPPVNRRGKLAGASSLIGKMCRPLDEQDGDAALPSGGAEARNGRASAKSRRASARYPCGPDVASKAVLQHHEGCMEAVRTHHSFVLPRRAG